jgi:predicted DNA-binding transcriptional regulator AlpA
MCLFMTNTVEQNHPPSSFMRIRDIAIFLDICEMTARRMVLAKKFGSPVRLPNGQLRVLRSAVEAYAASIYVPSPNN